MKKKLFIVIPVYNEHKVIQSVIHGLQKIGYKNIIVIDDGSIDVTFDTIRTMRIYALRHQMNRGKGAALKTGMEAAKYLGADIVVTFDGDGQHDPRDIKQLIKKIGEGYQVVLGSRYIAKQNIPFMRRIGNGCANILTYLLYGIWATDSQSGLRAYTKTACDIINTKSDRYEVESEVLRDIKRYNLSYIEVPMKVRYTRYSLTKSTKQGLWSGFITMVRLFFNFS